MIDEKHEEKQAIGGHGTSRIVLHSKESLKEPWSSGSFPQSHCFALLEVQNISQTETSDYDLQSTRLVINDYHLNLTVGILNNLGTSIDKIYQQEKLECTVKILIISHKPHLPPDCNVNFL